jgi:hypothetical protein
MLSGQLFAMKEAKRQRASPRIGDLSTRGTESQDTTRAVNPSHRQNNLTARADYLTARAENLTARAENLTARAENLTARAEGRDAQVGALVSVPPVEIAVLVGSGLAALARDNHNGNLNVP